MPPTAACNCGFLSLSANQGLKQGGGVKNTVTWGPLDIEFLPKELKRTGVDLTSIIPATQQAQIKRIYDSRPAEAKS
jgi:hypothetical protein